MCDELSKERKLILSLGWEAFFSVEPSEGEAARYDVLDAEGTFVCSTDTRDAANVIADALDDWTAKHDP